VAADADAHGTVDRIAAAAVVRQIAALAGTTFRQAIRMKVFAAPLVFALTVAVASPFLPSDGTPAGAVRLAISVNLVAAGLFGAVAAVMLSSVIYAREWRDRTDLLLATKPMPRWALYAGRSAGVAAVMVVVIAGMAALAWGLVSYVAARESARSADARAVIAEIVASRDTIGPVWETGPERAPQTKTEGLLRVPPGGTVQWRFSLPAHRSATAGSTGRLWLARPAAGVGLVAVNPVSGEAMPMELSVDPFDETTSVFTVPERLLAPAPESPRGPRTVYFEFTNRSASDTAFTQNPPIVLLAGAYVYVAASSDYRWVFNLPEGPHAAPAFRLRLARAYTAGARVEIAMYRTDAPDAVERHVVDLGPRQMMILPVSGGLVARGGRLKVVMKGLDGTIMRVPAVESLTFAPLTGSLAGALFRWAVLEVAKTLFLVLVTCAGATFLSFPIPALLGGAFVVGGYLVSFVTSLAASGGEETPAIVTASLWMLRGLLPDFTEATAIGMVYEGVAIPWGFVGSSAVAILVLRGGVAAAIGGIMSHRREYGA
jgi:hypothetical protein